MSVLSTALAARNHEVQEGVNQTHYFMFAARPALDWIAKALPILKSLRDVTESVPRLGDDGKIDRVYKESLTYLTALIAQAEGQKEMKE